MRTTTIILCALTGLTACEWNSNQKQEHIDANVRPRPDVPMSDLDADVDMPAGTAKHLLLTEVALAGTEFVEITNPKSTDVSLADYYLSDNGNYWKLPAGAPTIGATDFIVELPMAGTIAAGASITVAIGTATAFNTAYGMMPTYSIASGTVTKTVVTGTPTLTDGGEIVVLFHWDGTAGLVKDVDMMIAGQPTAANALITKSGAALGSSTYATDGDSIQSQTATPGTGVSTKRTMAETGHETQAGTGNGIDGDDETSEDTRTTWDSTFTAATPNTAPAL